MKPLGLPLLVQAELRVAAKIKNQRLRGEAINEVLKEARKYYPDCFIDTIGLAPAPREKTSWEKYIDSIKPIKYSILLK